MESRTKLETVPNSWDSKEFQDHSREGSILSGLSNHFDKEAMNSLIRSFDNMIVSQRTFSDIPETITIPKMQFSCNVFKWYKVRYPSLVIKALEELYAEYNSSFDDLIQKNTEWDEDYQYSYDNNQNPVNYFCQIDMTWIPQEFLDQVEKWFYTKEQVKAILRNRIFEFENSLAMSGLLSNMFAKEGESFFWEKLWEVLEGIRKKFGKPIAILTVTDEKYNALKKEEFWQEEDEELDSDRVRKLTWFDTLLSPDEFKKILEKNGGEAPYIVYVRSSIPNTNLRRPGSEDYNQLLEDDMVRKAVRKNSISLNVDKPSMEEEEKINDTKEYQLEMWMSYPISDLADFFSEDFADYLKNGKPPKKSNVSKYDAWEGDRLSKNFKKFLEEKWISPSAVENGEIEIRAKPLKESYWCYGHIKWTLDNKKFRQELSKEISRRGSYVIQLEMPQPTITNEYDDQQFMFIDRVFFGYNQSKWEEVFMGWFRSLMPVDSVEAKKWRNHWNENTHWVEITN